MCCKGFFTRLIAIFTGKKVGLDGVTKERVCKDGVVVESKEESKEEDMVVIDLGPSTPCVAPCVAPCVEEPTSPYENIEITGTGTFEVLQDD